MPRRGQWDSVSLLWACSARPHKAELGMRAGHCPSFLPGCTAGLPCHFPKPRLLISTQPALPLPEKTRVAMPCLISHAHPPLNQVHPTPLLFAATLSYLSSVYPLPTFTYPEFEIFMSSVFLTHNMIFAYLLCVLNVVCLPALLCNLEKHRNFGLYPLSTPCVPSTENSADT